MRAGWAAVSVSGCFQSNGTRRAALQAACPPMGMPLWLQLHLLVRPFAQHCVLPCVWPPPHAPHRCLNCILDKKACQHCVYARSIYGTGPASPGSCIACKTRHGAQSVGGCNACAQSQQPGRCMSCMARFPFSWCPNDGPPAGCQTLFDSTPCDTCANDALGQGAFDDCVSCHAGGNINRYECSGCLAAPTQALQRRCYSCIRTAGFSSPGYYGCAACFGQWQAQGQQDKCLACVEDSRTSMPAKQECAFCYGEYGPATDELRSKCVSCLQQPHDDYAAACELNKRRRRQARRL